MTKNRPPQKHDKDLGNITNAFFSKDAVKKALVRAQTPGIDLSKSNSMLFKFYRTAENPEKVVMASFVGDNKSSVSGGANALDEKGAVYANSVAALRARDLEKLFSKTIQDITVDEIIEDMSILESVDDVLKYIPQPA